MSLVVQRIATEAGDPSTMAAATLRWPGSSQEIYFRASRGPVTERADPFFAAALIPAMCMGQDLCMCQPVSRQLLQSARAIQEIAHSFEGTRPAIQVDAPTEADPPLPVGERGVACFFSGGVDSFYSVLRHQEEITHLILIHGFDVALDAQALRTRVSEELQAAAKDLGKKLIEVETNLRQFADPHADWGTLYHGSALASVALLLAPQITKCYIPSTQFYREPRGWGSCPEMDPLWSTENVRIVHDEQTARGEGRVRGELCHRLALSASVLSQPRRRVQLWEV